MATTHFEYEHGLITVDVFTGSWSDLAALEGDHWHTKVVNDQPVACRVLFGEAWRRPVEHGESVVCGLGAAELDHQPAESPLQV